MRVALIADIHGNALALDTVLAELSRDHVDQIVCLGDVVEGGPQPREILDRIRALGCPIVMGNTDERMLSHRRDEPRYSTFRRHTRRSCGGSTSSRTTIALRCAAFGQLWRSPLTMSRHCCVVTAHRA
jgi:3',5'-cyclic AMP phosphodiesterase CpdA